MQRQQLEKMEEAAEEGEAEEEDAVVDATLGLEKPLFDLRSSH